ncbi:MAG: hypothetical protein KatS3mg008_0749 [Acidimicrobiales bacterium]|nr:MAG: hypothetical protein KatS3mg008_0749 [Acidimicrobiales bacterium]
MTSAADDRETGTKGSDLLVGSFTEEGPWELRRGEVSWLRDVEMLREIARRSVPQMTRPRRLPPGPRVASVVRHLGTAVLAWSMRERKAGGSVSRRGLSRRLRKAAERLGPTYIKLGQIIASGKGIFPTELVEEFEACRDRVPAEPFPVVRSVIEEDFGKPLEDVFEWFDPDPVAAASIAQVHRARLASGEHVVVKVQRPTVRNLVEQDIAVMAWLAPFLVGRIPVAALANPPALVELFAQTISEELDFRLEAANMLDVAAVFADVGQSVYVVPRPHPRLVTERVLVMEELSGFRPEEVDALREAGVDTRALVTAGLLGFMEGAMLHGVFHGDLHGGNLVVLPDGRIGLLDYGITGRLGARGRLAFVRLLVAATMNDVRGQIEAFRDLGALPPEIDVDELIEDLGLDRPPVDPTSLSAEELTQEIQRAVKGLLEHGARLPKELMLLIKNLVFLDEAIATLAPDVDVFSLIAHISEEIARRHGERIASELGMDAGDYRVDLDGMKAAFGVDPQATPELTYQEILRRRQVIRERMRERRRRRSSALFGRFRPRRRPPRS